MLHLSQDLENRLNSLAQRIGQDENTLAAAAITEYLNDLEDLIIARERMADVEAGKVQLIDFEDVLAQYAVEN